MKLGSWIAHFTRRMDQYNDWIDNGEPAVMWLSGLGIPESYLTALIQTCCRRRNWSLDRSAMFTRVTDVVDACSNLINFDGSSGKGSAVLLSLRS